MATNVAGYRLTLYQLNELREILRTNERKNMRNISELCQKNTASHC